MSAADEQYLDKYDEYNIEQDKYIHSHHGGKGRTKKETAQQHSSHAEPGGDTRKNMQKLVNNAHKQQEQKQHK